PEAPANRSAAMFQHSRPPRSLQMQARALLYLRATGTSNRHPCMSLSRDPETYSITRRFAHSEA
ncbi:MAG TPA: hypothetical protein VGS41_13605, partial [Chthonomonadales bacterium]|nr:hypothetical protein [Chthonomonadales bacterium]